MDLAKVLTELSRPLASRGGSQGPRDCSRSIRRVAARRDVEAYSALVLRILDGFDPRSLPRQVDRQGADSGRTTYNAIIAEHERRIKSVQERWLASKGLR